MIEKEIYDKKTSKGNGGVGLSRQERAIRFGRLATDTTTLGFPNFFTAQKVKTKITIENEKCGNTFLLNEVKDKKGKKAVGGRKNTKTEDEDSDDGFQAEYEGTYTKNDLTEYKKEKKTEIDFKQLETKADQYNKNVQAKKLRIDDIKKELFQKMKFYQDCGLNILVYGVGSKRHILNLYLLEQLKLNGHSCVAINGYHSATSMKSILTTMFNYLKSCGKMIPKPVSMQQQFEYAKRAFMMPDISPLYLVIHSLDIGQLKSEDSVQMLAELASTGKLKLVISLDHIKSGILFSDHTLDQLNVVCVEMNTFQSFFSEMQY